MQQDFLQAEAEKQNVQLRPYQEEILRLTTQEISNNPKTRSLVQLPTGMGKTVCFAALISQLKKRTLVIAHREELLVQAKEKIASFVDRSKIDVVLQSKPDPSASIWVASVQTLVRGNRLNAISPRLIVIDEAHHSCASTYRKIMEHFKDVPCIGFTATPTRSTKAEKELLSILWRKMLFSMSVKQAVKDGWLAKIQYYKVKTGIDLNSVKTTAGDFQIDQLADQVNNPARNNLCVEKYLELGGGKAIVFCVDVQHVKDMQQSFVNKGVDCDIVIGSTDSDERRQTLRKFHEAASKQNIVLVNCAVLTEGFDCPDIRQVILARPTQSEVIYLQMLGRGTRKAADKDSIIILDITDSYRKGLCNCLKNVFNIKSDVVIEGDVLEALDRSKKRIKKLGRPDEAEASGVQEDRAIESSLLLADILFDMPDQLENSELNWFSPEEKKYVCQVEPGKSIAIYDNALSYKMEWCDYPEGFYDLNLNLESTDINKLIKIAEDHVSLLYQETRFIWDKKFRKNLSEQPPTEKQIQWLNKIAPNVDPAVISRETASQIISAHLERKKLTDEPATVKQINFLRFLGYRDNSDNLTKSRAKKLISELVKGQPVIHG